MDIKVLATGSKGNCYLLTNGEDILCLDAGISAEQILEAVGFKPTAIQGVLCTHAHKDHCRGLQGLADLYIETYASDMTYNACKIQKTTPTVKNIPDGVFLIDNWFVSAFETEHDMEGAYGFYIGHKNSRERILYVTDTAYIPVNPRGITCLISECNYEREILKNKKDDLKERYKRLTETHMSLDRLLSYIKKIDRNSLHTIVITHLSDTNSNEKNMIEQLRLATGCNVYAANKGMEIKLDKIPF